MALAVRFVPFSELVEWDLSPTRSKDCPVPFLEDHRLKEIAKDGLLQQSAASPNGLSTARPRLNSVASERCEQIEPVRFAGSPSAQNQPTLSALGHLSPTAKGERECRMKVLFKNAKATWLFDLHLLNPFGLKVSSLMAGVAERYKFARVPATPLDVKEGGLQFVEGVFCNSKGIEVGVSLNVYGDGVVADTFSDTDNSTEFLRDLSQYATSLGFGFPDESEIGKGFSSALTVSVEKSLKRSFPSLDPIAQAIEQSIVTMDGKPRSFELTGISMYSEDIGQNKSPLAFKFERKWLHPFDTNRYYCQAPLETHKHIAIMQELEKLLST